MNFAKYLFAFLFALSLTVVMVGCGGADSADTSENDTEDTTYDEALDDEATDPMDDE